MFKIETIALVMFTCSHVQCSSESNVSYEVRFTEVNFINEETKVTRRGKFLKSNPKHM